MKRRVVYPAVVALLGLGLVGSGVVLIAQEEGGEDASASASAQEKPRAYLGVQLSDLPEELAAHLDLESGVLVREVVAETPAAKAGIERFDVIRSVDGTAVETSADVVEAIGARAPGDSLTLALRRGGKDLELTVELAELSASEEPRGEKEPVAGAAPGFLGVLPGQVPEALSAQLDLEPGAGALVGDVVPDSPAAKAGIERFDVIVSVGGETVHGPGELVERLGKNRAGDRVGIEKIHKGERSTVDVVLAPRPLELGLPPGPGQRLRGPGWFELEDPGARGYRLPPRLRGNLFFRGPNGEERQFTFPEGRWDIEELQQSLDEALRRWNVDDLDGQLNDRLREFFESHRVGPGAGRPVETAPDVHEIFKLKVVEDGEVLEVDSANGRVKVKVQKDGETQSWEVDAGDLSPLPEDVRTRVESFLRGSAPSPGGTPSLRNSLRFNGREGVRA